MGMVDNLVADIRRVVEQLDKLFVFTDKEVCCSCVSIASCSLQLIVPAVIALQLNVHAHCMQALKHIANPVIDIHSA